ncbi:helix-turn-helix domain-containing protein [Bacillus cereus]|nr:helix-turn-helix domain-containing protein [Bacillus cereus]
MNNNFDIKFCEDGEDVPIFSKRSALYSVEPIGKGTSYVESVTSYICRLAYIHHLTISALLLKKIYPYTLLTETRKVVKVHEGSYINGVGKIAQRYVTALEELTQRNDLNQLTLLNWSKILNKSQINEYKRWCPKCIEDWKISGQKVYEPLIWHFKEVKICDIHEYKLQENCPRCERNIPYFSTYIRIGYCPYCQSDLGDMNYYEKTNYGNIAELEKQVVEVYAQLIKSNFSLTAVPLRSTVNHFFKRLLVDNKQIKHMDLARHMNIKRNRIEDWIYGNCLPSIEFWAKMHNLLGVPINIFLLEDTDLSSISTCLASQKRQINIKKRHQKDKNEIKDQLIRYLQTCEESGNIISLSELAKIKGFSYYVASNHFPHLKSMITKRYKEFQKSKKENDVQKLGEELQKVSLDKSMYKWGVKTALKKSGIGYDRARKYFPGLCREISNNHLGFVEKNKKERLNRIKEDIKTLIISLHKEKIIPKDATVMYLYPQSIVFKDSVYREYLKEVRKELGYDF